MKIGASYCGDLFSTCQQLLGHACHIWYSLGLKSLTHNHTTRAGPVRIRCVMRGMFERKWKGRASVPKHWEFFKWTLKFFANFDQWLHCMTCWCVISLRWCHIMAIHKYYAICLKRLSPTPDACSPLLALSVFIGAGQPLQHSEVRGSYLAWVRPVFISPLCEIKLNLLSTVLLNFKAARELWNPLSKSIPGKFQGSARHCRCNCLQIRASFYRFGSWQMVLIFYSVTT